MKVGELRAALAALPADLDVIVRTEDDDGNSYCGSPRTASLQYGCDDEPFFAIDCDSEPESEPPPSLRLVGGEQL